MLQEKLIYFFLIFLKFYNFFFEIQNILFLINFHFFMIILLVFNHFFNFLKFLIKIRTYFIIIFTINFFWLRLQITFTNVGNSLRFVFLLRQYDALKRIVKFGHYWNFFREIFNRRIFHCRKLRNFDTLSFQSRIFNRFHSSTLQ